MPQSALAAELALRERELALLREALDTARAQARTALTAVEEQLSEAGRVGHLQQQLEETVDQMREAYSALRVQHDAAVEQLQAARAETAAQARQTAAEQSAAREALERAEHLRVAAEWARQRAEQERDAAWASAQEAERARQAIEDVQAGAAQRLADLEAARQRAEDERDNAQASAQAAERARQEAIEDAQAGNAQRLADLEAARQSAEAERDAAQASAQAAEQARQEAIEDAQAGNAQRLADLEAARQRAEDERDNAVIALADLQTGAAATELQLRKRHERSIAELEATLRKTDDERESAVIAAADAQTALAAAEFRARKRYGRTIAELEAACAEALARTAQAEADLSVREAVRQRLEQDLEAATARAAEAETAEALYAHRLRKLQEQLTARNADLDALQQSLTTQAGATEAALASAQAATAGVQRLERSHQEAIATMRAALDEREAALDHSQQRLLEVEALLTAGANARHADREAFERLTIERDAAVAEREALQTQWRHGADTIAALRDSTAALEAEIAAQRLAYEQLDQARLAAETAGARWQEQEQVRDAAIAELTAARDAAVLAAARQATELQALQQELLQTRHEHERQEQALREAAGAAEGRVAALRIELAELAQRATAQSRTAEAESAALRTDLEAQQEFHRSALSRIRDLEHALATHENASLVEREDLSQQGIALLAERTQLAERCEILAQQRADTAHSLAAAEARLADLQATCERLANDRSALTAEAHEAASTLESMRAQWQESLLTAREAEARLAAVAQERDAALARSTAVAEDLESTAVALDAARGDALQLREQLEELAALRQRCSAAEAAAAQAVAEREQLRTALGERLAEGDILSARATSLADTLTTIQRTEGELRGELQQARAELAAAALVHRHTKAAHDRLAQDLASVQEELAGQRAVAGEFEVGLAAAIRARDEEAHGRAALQAAFEQARAEAAHLRDTELEALQTRLLASEAERDSVRAELRKQNTAEEEAARQREDALALRQHVAELERQLAEAVRIREATVTDDETRAALEAIDEDDGLAVEGLLEPQDGADLASQIGGTPARSPDRQRANGGGAARLALASSVGVAAATAGRSQDEPTGIELKPGEALTVVHVEDQASLHDLARTQVEGCALARYAKLADLPRGAGGGAHLLAVNLLARDLDPFAVVCDPRWQLAEPRAFAYLAAGPRGLIVGLTDFFPFPLEPDECATRLLNRPGGTQRLLMVSDEIESMNEIGGVLGRIRCSASLALDGRQAWDLIGPVKPDVILVDLNLPRADGIRLISRLRSNPATAAMPVVLASSKKFDAARFRTEAASALRDSRLSPEDLAAAFGRVLAEVHTPPAAGGAPRTGLR